MSVQVYFTDKRKPTTSPQTYASHHIKNLIHCALIKKIKIQNQSCKFIPHFIKKYENQLIIYLVWQLLAPLIDYYATQTQKNLSHKP